MIQDKIEQAKRTPRKPAIAGFIDGLEGRCYMFTKPELLSLLREVAAEQREICAEQFMSKKFTSAKNVLEKVNLLENAPSPLDRGSHG